MTVSASFVSNKVAAVLAQYGRDITITSAVDAYVVEDGTNTPTLTDNTVRSTPPYAYDRRYVDGNTVREGDVRFLVSGTGLTFTLALGQKITDGAKVYRIVSIQPATFDSGGLTYTAYELQARGDG